MTAVLVVDPSLAMRQTVGLVLQGGGHHVTDIASAAEGVRRARGGPTPSGAQTGAAGQAQPKGPGRNAAPPFFRPAALALAYVKRLHRARAALLVEKMASGRRVDETSTGPSLPAGGGTSPCHYYPDHFDG